jgi:RND family efflux transporter MFP subunit
MDIEKVKRLRLHPAEGEAPQPEAESGFKRPALVILIAGIAFAAGWLLRPMFNPAVTEERVPALAAAERSGSTPPASAQTAGTGRNFTAAGYLEPLPPYPVKVTPLVSGRLELFEVLEGMPVEKGRTIARLDSAALERQALELQAALAVNAARIEHARSIAKRSERLADIGSASRRELEQARAELAVLEAEGNRLGEELASVRWQIENTELRAPVTGVLYERLAQSGQWVGPGHESAIASIYDPKQLQVWVDVNQRDATRVWVGQRVEVSLDAEPGRTFAGRVSRILPRGSIAKNTVQAKVALEETSTSLRPDMSVKVSFLAEAEPSNATNANLNP